MPLPASERTAGATIVGYTQTAPTVGMASSPNASTRSARNGARALAHRRATRSGVSSPDKW